MDTHSTADIFALPSDDLAFIAWDPEFRVADWSTTAEQIFGYTAKQARGLTGDDLVPETVRPHVRRIWEDQLRESGGHFSRNPNVTRDGRVIICEWYNTPLVNARGEVTGVLSLAKDVTAQERAARRLQESPALADNLIATMQDGMSVVGPDLVTIRVNGAFCRMTGFSEEDLVGTSPPFPYWPPEHYDELQRCLQAMTDGRKSEVETVYARRDGTRFPVLVTPSHVRNDRGGLIAYMATVKDITERKRYEQELERARDVAEEMNRLKSAFLANMSHEIRTPLTAILGFADVIQESARRPDADPDEQREQAVRFARLIERGGLRLLHTLNAVLDLSRLEAGLMLLDPGWVDVAAEVRAAVDRVRSAAREGGVTLDLDVPGTAVGAEFDASALRRILDNLLGNAVKFTPPGGRVTARVRRDASEPDRPGVRLEVIDTGIGIDPAFAARVFEPFEQESTGTARSHEGSGLGLAVTYHLVRLMDGTITVDSTKGQGTTITVHLPG